MGFFKIKSSLEFCGEDSSVISVNCSVANKVTGRMETYGTVKICL